MLVYLSVIICLVIFHYSLSNNKGVYSRKERRYVFYTCAIFVLLAALRWIIPGTDIEGYMGDYGRMQTNSFRDIWDNWQGNYVAYYSTCKLFGYSSLPYHFWFGFVQLVTVSGFIRIINRFSSDRIICLLLFFTVGLFTFSITGLKQAFAMGLVWHAYAFMADKKYLLTILCSVLAFYSHKTSAIFMLSFVLLLLQNMKQLYTTIASIAILILTIVPSQVLSFMSNYLGDEHYLEHMQGDSSYSYTTFLFYLALFGIAYFSKNKNKQQSTIIFSMAVISVVLNLFAQVVDHAFRLALYYTPFLIIMVSNRVRDKKSVFAVILLTSFYMLYTSRDFLYKFFWQ